MVFMTIGPKLNHKEGVERFSRLGKEKWIHKESKACKRMYSVYEGKNKHFYKILLGVGILVVFLNLMYFKNESRYFLIYMWVVSLFIIVKSIFAIITQNRVLKKTNTFVDKLSKGNRNVGIEDGYLINKTDTVTTSWDLNNLLFMAETFYGYILIFKDIEVSFVDIKGSKDYDILHQEIKEYVSEEQYLPMFMKL